MPNHEHRSNEGSMDLPMYLVVAAIVSSICIGILILSLLGITGSSEQIQTEQQLQEIDMIATQMVEFSHLGARKTFEVSFPSAMNYAALGSIPSSAGATHMTFDANTSNLLGYLMGDGTLDVLYSSAHYCGSPFGNTVVLLPGTYAITLELISQGAKTYVQVTTS